jgi:GNAT superfamily N-acetyltransferase
MVEFIRTDNNNEGFKKLIELLDQELLIRYGQEQRKLDKHNKIDNCSNVVLAIDNNIPIGCGCFKRYNEDTAEIKRMFVKATHRRRGISKTVLAELEKWIKTTEP